MKNFLLVFFVALLCIFFITTLSLQKTEVSNDKERLLTELEDFLPSSVSAEEMSEKQIGAYYYATLHSLEPIFALAGTDTESLRYALRQFQENAEVASKIYEDELYTESLFPLDFLNRLSELEDFRRALLSDVTQENAISYHKNLDRLFQEYKKSLTLFSQQAQEGELITVGSWQGQTDNSFIYKKIDSVLQSISTLEENENSRYACLNDISNCESLDTVRTDSRENSPETLTSPETSQNIPLDTRKIISFYNNFFLKFNKEEPLVLSAEQSDPIILLDNSYCSTGTSSQYAMLYSYHSKVHTELLSTRVLALDSIYFNDTQMFQNSGYLPSELKIPEQYRYTLQPPNHYTCVDYGYDHQTTLTILYIRKLLLDRTFSLNNFPELQKLEEVITTSDVVSENDVQRFIDILDTFYKTKGRTELESSLGIEGADYIINLIHVWKSQSGFFQTIIGMLDDSIYFSRLAHPDGSPRIPSNAFFFTYTNFVSLYQLANQTVVRNSTTFLRFSNKEHGLQAPSEHIVTDYKKLIPEFVDSIEFLDTYAIKNYHYVQKLLEN